MPNDINKAKIKATINWLEDVHKSFFGRLDGLWDNLSKGCVDCMKKNCEAEYEWIKRNSFEINKNSSREFTEIKFPPEIGAEGIKALERYKKCKGSCYEKLIVMNSTLGRCLLELNEHMGNCIDSCKISKNSYDFEKSECINKCLIHVGYQLPKIEYYIESAYNSIKKEYDFNIMDLPKTDLAHHYRYTYRSFGKDIAHKYL